MEQLVTSGDVSTFDQDTAQPYILLRLLPGEESYAALYLPLSNVSVP